MVKVITDSVSDIPPETAAELGITVVPLHVRFGEQDYLDRTEITSAEFYRRLASGPVFPTTSSPSPEEFAAAFDRLAEETDEVLAVLLSSKFSVTYDAAMRGRELMQRRGCRVEVLDSLSAVMTLGFAAMAAARAAQQGMGMAEVMEAARQTMSRVHLLACFDSLEYLRRGGRIGRAAAFFGCMLKVNPVITLRNGLIEPVSRERGRARAIERLFEFAATFEGRIARLALEFADYGDAPSEAESLARRLGQLLPEGQRPLLSTVSPVIGAHTGPGIMIVSVEEKLMERSPQSEDGQSGRG